MSQPDLAAAQLAREFIYNTPSGGEAWHFHHPNQSVKTLVALLKQVEQQAREQERLRCLTIAAYSIDNAHDRDKTVARIREGHEQHTNRGGEPAPAREMKPNE